MAEGTVWRVPPKHAVFPVPVGTDALLNLGRGKFLFACLSCGRRRFQSGERLLQRRPAGGKLRSEIAEVPAKVSLPFSPPAVGASALEREGAEKALRGRFCKAVFTYGQE